MKTVNVLLSSVGRRVELVRAFRSAYGRLGISGRVLGTDVDPLAPALQEVDAALRVPLVGEADFVDRLAAICRRERVDLLFPLTDREIPVLAEARGTLEASGTAVAVLDPQAVAVTTDKVRTAEFFEDLGLSVPRTWLPGEADVDRLDYPVFVKPRNGSAGIGAFKARNARELEFFSSYVNDAIVQEFLPGPEVTSDVVCGLDGEVLGVVSRRRIEVRAGEVSKGVTIRDERILEGCVAVAKALPARGPVTVQCMMRAGEPVFTEINARFGGGVPLGIAAGVDGPAWLLARAAGVEIDIPPLGSYEPGLYLTRYDDSHILKRLPWHAR